MNNDKHKLYMLRILKDVFNDPELSQILAFKGGTSLMFFYQLPRFSVDLDFNILDITQKDMAYQKMREIALKYGRIADEQLKHNDPLVILDYEKGERNLKLEFSTRFFDNHYELKNLAGTNITVMVEPDMFAHKLCALLDRGGMAGRDVFDIHFFLSKQTPIHAGIVEQRMQKPFANYIDDCITALQTVSTKELMQNVGEFIEGKLKQEMKSGKLIDRTIEMLEERKIVPFITEYPRNRMPIENATITHSPEGKNILLAQIAEISFMKKEISTKEFSIFQALPKDEDRKNFLVHLARENYFDEWQKQSVRNTHSLKR